MHYMQYVSLSLSIKCTNIA